MHTVGLEHHPHILFEAYYGITPAMAAELSDDDDITLQRPDTPPIEAFGGTRSDTELFHWSGDIYFSTIGGRCSISYPLDEQTGYGSLIHLAILFLNSLDRQFLDSVDNDGAFTLKDFNRLQTRLVLPGEPPPDRLYGDKVCDDLKHLTGPGPLCIQIVFTVPARAM